MGEVKLPLISATLNIMSKRIDKKLWGVLGKQQTYYSPQQFLQGKTKVPLNASPFESWDAKRSKYNRVDGFENRIQQHGVVPQGTTPSVSPTPSITPSQTPGSSPTPTPSNTATNTSTPTPTPSITPVVDCYWNTNDDNWNEDSTLWNDCVNVPSPTPTNTQTNTPTNTTSNTPTNTPSNTPTNTQTTTPTNTPTPSTSPPPSGTTEARTYLAAVLAGGGTGLTSTISAATETLFTSLVSNNLWDKITIFYPFLGGTSGGCKVNGKNPGTNDLTFNGGWTFGVSGATPNGTNGFADTSYSYRNLSVNSNHSSMYSLTRSENNASEWGATDGTGRYLVYLNQLNNSLVRTFGIAPFKSANYDEYSNNTNVRGDGMYVMNRSSSTDTQGYINGIRYINTTTSTSTSYGSTNYNIYLGARNAAGTAAAFSDRRFAFWTIGTSLTSGETATLSTIINTFQTSLLRNTY